MKSRDLDRLFVRKMAFELRSRSKHDDYQVRVRNGNLIPLPALLTLSRGPGEIAIRNLKGLAENLGLTLHALEDAGRCNLGRGCILVCMTGHLLEFGMERCVRRGEEALWDEEMLLRLCESAGLLLDEAAIELARDNCSKNQEQAELRRVREQLEKAFATFQRDILAGKSHFELETAVNRCCNFVKQYGEEK